MTAQDLVHIVLNTTDIFWIWRLYQTRSF